MGHRFFPPFKGGQGGCPLFRSRRQKPTERPTGRTGGGDGGARASEAQPPEAGRREERRARDAARPPQGVQGRPRSAARARHAARSRPEGEAAARATPRGTEPPPPAGGGEARRGEAGGTPERRASRRPDRRSASHRPNGEAAQQAKPRGGGRGRPQGGRPASRRREGAALASIPLLPRRRQGRRRGTAERSAPRPSGSWGSERRRRCAPSHKKKPPAGLTTATIFRPARHRGLIHTLCRPAPRRPSWRHGGAAAPPA